MEPIKIEIKQNHTVAIIVTIVVAAFLIQWYRFHSKIKTLTNGMGAVLPANYFPFNGSFVRNANGDIKRA